MWKLCGGTLFVLLLQSRKKKYDKKDEASFLAETLKILHPTLNFTDSPNTQKSNRTSVNRFKICSKGTSTFATQFMDKTLKDNLTKNITEQYKELLERSEKYVKENIETKSDKDVLFVKALLEVIAQDKSIKDNEQFYVFSDGQSVSKKELCSMQKFYFPSFFLGIWYYVMIHIEDNSEGKDTYDEWCPKGGKKRPYTAKLGENSPLNIELSPEPIPKKECLTKSLPEPDAKEVFPISASHQTTVEEKDIPNDIISTNNNLDYSNYTNTYYTSYHFSSGEQIKLLDLFRLISEKLELLTNISEEYQPILPMLNSLLVPLFPFKGFLLSHYIKKFHDLKSEYNRHYSILLTYCDIILTDFAALKGNTFNHMISIVYKIVYCNKIKTLSIGEDNYHELVSLNEEYKFYYDELLYNLK